MPHPTPDQSSKSEQAAAMLYPLWQQAKRCSGLTPAVRPADRGEGYAVQTAFARLYPSAVFGWKIAATSIEGQRHIGVDGPLAGRLFADRVMESGAAVPLAGNLMRVAEIEFAFRFRHALVPRTRAYTVDDVLAAVGSVHPAIEVPDSRYEDFVTAGAPQLIADNACANLFVAGPPVSEWDGFDFVGQEIRVSLNGEATASGYGRNVLGDPRVALTWLVNELSGLGVACEKDQMVTTGTCRVPISVKPGDLVEADFGVLGRVSCRFG